MGLSETLALLLLGSALLFGLWGRAIAVGKGRNGIVWFVFSATLGATFWLGFLAILMLITLPRLNRERSN